MSTTAMGSYVHPLTTTFTPPASCLGPTFTVSPDGRDSITTEYSNYAAVRGLDPICYPQSFYRIRTTGAEGQSAAQYYSPGFCPAGYATMTFGSNPQATDTTATCCPSGMWLRPQDGGATGSLTTYCTGGFYTNRNGGPGNTPITVISGTSTDTTSIYVSYAVPVVVRFASSDVSLWSSMPTISTSEQSPEPSATSSSATSTSSVSATSPITPTSAPPEYTEPHSAGLSTGAMAGIGSGAGVAVIGAMALGCLLFKSRRKRRAAVPADPMLFPPYDNMDKGAPAYSNIPHMQHNGYPFAFDSRDHGFGPAPVQLDGTPKKNLRSSESAAELSAD